MNSPSNSPTDPSKQAGPPRNRLHPLVATAAGALIIASLVAVAAITGVLPGASSRQSNAPAVEQTAANTGDANAPGTAPQHGDSAAPATASTQAPVQETAPAAPAAPAPPQAQVQQPAPAQAPTSSVPQPPQSAQQFNQSQAPAPVAQAQQPRQQQPSYCASCGTVTSIEQVKVEGHGTGIGAVGGAAAGGLVGNQFGAGGGRAAMTVLGVVGGALAGNAVEKQVRSTMEYRVNVQTEDGHAHYFTYQQPPPFRNGDRVRIRNGVLVSD
jgi:outer membrane lipoprotein SlyB